MTEGEGDFHRPPTAPFVLPWEGEGRPASPRSGIAGAAKRGGEASKSHSVDGNLIHGNVSRNKVPALNLDFPSVKTQVRQVRLTLLLSAEDSIKQGLNFFWGGGGRDTRTEIPMEMDCLGRI